MQDLQGRQVLISRAFQLVLVGKVNGHQQAREPAGIVQDIAIRDAEPIHATGTS